jgi:purine-binding chemotaxis protein CheW
MSFEKRGMAEDEQLKKYLTLKVADEGYGIDIRSVTEIIGIQPVTMLPWVPKRRH